MNRNVRKSSGAAATAPDACKGLVKNETPDEEIKEYVKTTMNEMLGWYGYDKINSKDCSLQSMNLVKLREKYRGRSKSTEPETSSDEYNSPQSPTTSNSPVQQITCGWCDKTLTAKAFTFRTAESKNEKVFCSEQCFSQYRRANFKRNKTCDWCRHLRHTVNCVDFQDGDHQLQFCSDKCLNQYKMNIFCKETQAQLELHPHLQNSLLPENLCKTVEPNLPLITPDLWLRDCQSPPPPSTADGSPPSPQRPHSPPILPPSGPTVPQLRVSNKLFDRQTRKRKRTTAEDNVAPPVYPKFPAHAPVYCTPPLCRSPAFTQSQTTNNSTPANDPPPPPLYPLNMPPSLLPPPMILVPYPIMLPIPVPIPIPIPLPFFKKECDNTTGKEEKNEKKT